MRGYRRLLLLLTATAASGAGCTMNFGVFRRDGGAVTPDAEPTPDAADDAPAADADATAPLDARPDAAPDAPVPPDAPPDTRVDAGVDVPRDVPPDAPPDVRIDATPDADPCTPVLRVNEVQTGGAGGGFDEFVEIYNAGTCTVPLVGFTLRYRSSAGASESSYWTGGAGDTLAAGAYFVLGGSVFRDAGTSMGALTGGLAEPGGSVGIFSSAGTRLDSVAYGTGVGPLVETQAASAASAGSSIARIPNGADTNNNMADFQVRAAPTPGRPNS